MKLCEYRNLEIGKTEVSKATPEEVEEELGKLLDSRKALNAKEGKSEEGDTVNINYKGFLGEEQFEGGTADNYDLKLGSHTFIPGFEEQLVGYEAGSDVDVNVTFPEEYHAENLKGKAVVFKCHVNEVKSEYVPKFDEEFARGFGFDTPEALKTELERQMNAKKQNDADNDYLSRLMKHITENSEIDVPDEKVKKRIDEMMDYYEQQIAGYGMDLNTYLSMTGMTAESFRDQLASQALESAQEDEVFAEIVKLENITVSDEELEKELAMYKDYYQLDDAKFAEFRASEAEAVKESIGKRKACVLLIDNNK